MLRIVDRDVYESKTGHGHDLIRRPLGNGHFEYRVVPIVVWEHSHCVDSDAEYAEYLKLKEQEKNSDERKEANLERAARRAKTRVRCLCKAAGVDTLLTLTYAANMCDWDTLVRHLKEFNRRMKKLIPGWFYVAAFERQKRGAFHAHMAVHRLPALLDAKGGVKVKSFNVVRAVWRSVTGELGGNIDVQSRKRNSQRAPSRIAAYISKYMTKAFADGEPWSKRFSSSKGVSIPKSERIRFWGYSMVEVAQVVFDDLPAFATEQLRWGLNRWKDSLWWILDLNIRERARYDCVPSVVGGNYDLVQA